MAGMLKCVGLDFLWEDEDLLERILLHTIEHGKAIPGYDDYMYFRNGYGAVELVVKTKLTVENGHNKLDILDWDAHVAGPCAWTMRMITSIGDPNNKERTLALMSNYEDASGGACIDLLYSEVLPARLKDEKISIQVVGFADFIEYFDTAEAYENSMPEPELGKRIYQAEGTVFPNGLFTNEDGKVSEFQDVNVVRAVVKQLYKGYIQLGEAEREEAFIRCVVDTNFGELEIVHTIDQVDEAYRENMKPGATVIAAVVLSGDPAIYEYEDGRIIDEEHDLDALREVFEKGKAWRIADRVADDCVYSSEVSGAHRLGKKPVLDRFNYVHRETRIDYTTLKATLTADVETESGFAHPAGDRCIAVFGDEKIESIAFVTYDEKNKISGITLLDGETVQVEVEYDPPNRDFELEDLVRASIEQAVHARADLLGLTGDSREECDFSNEEDYREISAQMMRQIRAAAALPCSTTAELEEHYQDMIGEHFAKSFGHEGEELYLTHGRRFYKDARFGVRPADLADEEFLQDLRRVMVYLHYLGKKYQEVNNNEDH